MSPTEWCISTYAVPGASGPAHVPMIPFTAMKPLITGDSNHRSSRSVALIEKRRVMSATVFSSISFRSCQPSIATSLMSRNLLEPTCGGVRMSIGPRMSEIRLIQS